MLESKSARLFLAVLTALAGPLWCCCAAEAHTGPSHDEPCAAHASKNHLHPAAVNVRAGGEHRKSHPSDHDSCSSGQRDECHSSSSSNQPHEPCDCDCQGSSELAPAREGRAFVSALGLPTPPALFLPASSARIELAPLRLPRSYSFKSPSPPVLSLFSLRCLLTI